MLHRFGDRSYRSGHDWNAAGHCLHDRLRDAFLTVGRQSHKIHGPKPRHDVVLLAYHAHYATESERSKPGLQLRPVWSIANDNDGPPIPFRSVQCDRVEQVVVTLPGTKGRHTSEYVLLLQTNSSARGLCVPRSKTVKVDTSRY